MRDISDSIDIIEEFTCSKTADENNNEDGLFVNRNYVSVIDGATSKTDALYYGKTGGQILKDTVIRTLTELNGTECCTDVVSAIQKNVIRVKNALSIEHAAASLAIFSCCYNQLWLIGDCQARIGSETIDSKKKADAVLSEIRSFTIAALLKKGYTVEQLQEKDLARELILPFLKLQRFFENTDDKYGYYTLNTDIPPLNPEVITRVYQVHAGDEVILASDGYPVLKGSLAQSEECLFELIKEDPLFYKAFPSTKGVMKGNRSFDDRTYIRFIVKAK